MVTSPGGVAPTHALTGRIVRPWVIAVACVVHVAISIVVNQWLFPQRILVPIGLATGGLVRPTLSANVLMFTVTIVVVVFAIGRLRPSDVGLRLRGAGGVLPGIAAFAITWIAAQAVALAIVSQDDEPVRLAGRWIGEAAPWTVGALLAQLLGNALYEETLFRGFLLVQVLAWLSWRWDRDDAGDRSARPSARTVVAGVLATQAFFALIHVPNRLMTGQNADAAAWAIDLAILLVAGVVYAVIYLGLRNLWIVVALHALANTPTPLFGDTEDVVRNAVAACTLACLLLAIVVAVRRARVRTARPEVAP